MPDKGRRSTEGHVMTMIEQRLRKDGKTRLLKYTKAPRAVGGGSHMIPAMRAYIDDVRIASRLQKPITQSDQSQDS